MSRTNLTPDMRAILARNLVNHAPWSWASAERRLSYARDMARRTGCNVRQWFPRSMWID